MSSLQNGERSTEALTVCLVGISDIIVPHVFSFPTTLYIYTNSANSCYFCDQWLQMNEIKVVPPPEDEYPDELLHVNVKREDCRGKMINFVKAFRVSSRK